MKLEFLEPEFLRIVSNDAWMSVSDTILNPRVSGLRFMCPTCYGKDPSSAHYITCWRPDVPSHLAPRRGRWEFIGKYLHDLTLSAPVPCLTCRAIFIIEDGEVKE
jgi:hypothetical protein